MKDELDTRIDSLQSELERVKKQLSPKSLTLNVVITGIKQTPNENIVDKVNSVIKDGVKESIAVVSAIRKESRKEGKDGVVIATFASNEDKQKVMSSKKKLAKSNQYKHVSIFHDRPYEQRVQNANMRALVDLVGKDKVAMKGDRIVRVKNGTNSG